MSLVQMDLRRVEPCASGSLRQIAGGQRAQAMNLFTQFLLSGAYLSGVVLLGFVAGLIVNHVLTTVLGK